LTDHLRAAAFQLQSSNAHGVADGTLRSAADIAEFGNGNLDLGGHDGRKPSINLSLTSEARSSNCDENRRGASKMSATLWDELTRPEQRLLIRLFGGGSLRNQNAADIEGLRRRGLVDNELNLSMPGLLVFTLAMREQQADARWRTGTAPQ
jgi:hypothetical protein